MNSIYQEKKFEKSRLKLRKALTQFSCFKTHLLCCHCNRFPANCMESRHVFVALFFLLEQFPASTDGICQNFRFIIDENVIPDHALEGHVFKNSTVEKVTHCHMMCRDDCRCISMNYLHSKMTDNCQLNDVNKEMKPAALKYKTGSSYYDLMREYKVVSVAIFSN